MITMKADYSVKGGRVSRTITLTDGRARCITLNVPLSADGADGYVFVLNAEKRESRRREEGWL